MALGQWPHTLRLSFFIYKTRAVIDLFPKMAVRLEKSFVNKAHRTALVLEGAP